MSYDQQSQLIALIQEDLGNKIAPSSYGADVTLGQMRQAENQVIIFWDDETFAASFPNLLWNRDIFLCSTWYNVTSWSALQSALDQGIATKPQGQFYVNQAILTPDTEMIVVNFYSDLLSVEKSTNAQVISWYEQKAAAGMAGNILMVDNVASIAQQAFQISMQYNSHL